MDTETIIKRIRPLIGSHFDYLGHEWMLLEVLADEQQLVLASADHEATIQANLYGQPSRRVPETVMIPLYGSDGETFSEEFLELLSHRLHLQ